jgi:hypothetical protein
LSSAAAQSADAASGAGQDLFLRWVTEPSFLYTCWIIAFNPALCGLAFRDASRPIPVG